MLRFPGCARFMMASIIGGSTGVVQPQDNVAPRPDSWPQCANLSGMDSTSLQSIGHMTTISRAGCNHDCRVRLHASPHPGISDGAEGTLRGSPAQIFEACLSSHQPHLEDRLGVVWRASAG
jgi:hypothetical protein